MESNGLVVMTPVMVQAPAIAIFLNRILPSMTFTGTVFGPQLPIGEVKDTLRMLTFVALLASDFHGRPPRPTLVQPTCPLNVPESTQPTPAASTWPWNVALHFSVMPFFVADVLP